MSRDNVGGSSGTVAVYFVLEKCFVLGNQHLIAVGTISQHAVQMR